MTDIMPGMARRANKISKQMLVLAILLFIARLPIGSYAESREHTHFREEMRSLVKTISLIGKAGGPKFYIIPQNGLELLRLSGSDGTADVTGYLQALDGVGQESLHYGYPRDDLPTEVPRQDRLYALLDLAQENNKTVLIIDYCRTPSHIQDSFQRNARKGYIGFVATARALDKIPDPPPDPFSFNDSDVQSLNEIRNFLCLINARAYEDKGKFLEALRATDYDCLLIDPYYGGKQPLNRSEVESLKIKRNHGRRLVIAYMSIGEAEDYRYYWQAQWHRDKPEWLEEENPNWPGNFKVKYWHKDWQDILLGPGDSYLRRIMKAGFDGVYLDVIDAYYYFEAKQRQNSEKP